MKHNSAAMLQEKGLIHLQMWPSLRSAIGTNEGAFVPLYLPHAFVLPRMVLADLVGSQYRDFLMQGPYSDLLYKHEEHWVNWGEFKEHNDAWRQAIAAQNDTRCAWPHLHP